MNPHTPKKLNSSILRTNQLFKCRSNCGACCIAPTISSPIPGMPDGKPAGVQCVQLDSDMSCKIFAQPERPSVCENLKPCEEMCQDSKENALVYISWLEEQTN